MTRTYQAFLKKNIDLAPLGIEKRSDNTPYFCTPKGANIIGWAGVDGIHYCTIRGFGSMVFAVSPMNVGDYVHPIARSFEDMLRLLLTCADMAALEQCHAWDEEQYKAFLIDCPAASEQQAILDAIREKTGLAPIEDVFGYVKQLQTEFDLSTIPYSEDYYDEDMNPAAPQEPPAWEVYFDGNFWGHESGQRPGKEISLNTHFDWAGHHWVIPAVYSCAKGMVIDFCMRVEPDDIRAFMKKWNLDTEAETYQELTQEEQMMIDLDNPQRLDFNASLQLNGKVLRTTHGCGTAYNPCFPDGCPAELEAKWAVDHYGLDAAFGWVIWRSCYPWATKNKPTIKTLSVTMMQQKVSIPGPHFRIHVPGETFSFEYQGTDYTLTVEEYEAQTLDTSHMVQTMEYPTHHLVMSYTIAPELPNSMMTIADCTEGDRPRQKPREHNGFEATAVHDAAVIGIIGGADGPTAIVYGQARQSKLRVACSSLHFDPVDDVEWRMVFHEKQYEDATVEIVVPKTQM